MVILLMYHPFWVSVKFRKNLQTNLNDIWGKIGFGIENSRLGWSLNTALSLRLCFQVPWAELKLLRISERHRSRLVGLCLTTKTVVTFKRPWNQVAASSGVTRVFGARGRGNEVRHCASQQKVVTWSDANTTIFGYAIDCWLIQQTLANSLLW